MITRNMIAAAAVCMAAVLPSLAGDPSITVNGATQRWPWNNKIDVTYTVVNGQDRKAGLYCGVEFTITADGTERTAIVTIKSPFVLVVR